MTLLLLIIGCLILAPIVIAYLLLHEKRVLLDAEQVAANLRWLDDLRAANQTETDDEP